MTFTNFNQRQIELLENKFQKSTGCWNWNGAKTYNGYGVWRVQGNRCQAHHATLWHYRGIRVPAKMDVDHLCKNKACVNPFHLEVVTRSINIRRHFGTESFCKYGHDLRIHRKINKNGGSYCHMCILSASRKKCGTIWFKLDGKCKNGHELKGRNYMKNKGCRICHNAYYRDYRKNHKAQNQSINQLMG